MGQHSPPQLPNKPVTMQCTHKAYFQASVDVMMRLPRTRRHRVTAPAHSGDLERTGTPTFISWFWVQLTYGVQTCCNHEAKEEEEENTQDKKMTHSHLLFFFCPFRLRVIRTDQKIIQDYPSRITLKRNFLFTLHEKNTVIAQWQDLASKTQKHLL